MFRKHFSGFERGGNGGDVGLNVVTAGFVTHYEVRGGGEGDAFVAFAYPSLLAYYHQPRKGDIPQA